jgi:hypothetical protein
MTITAIGHEGRDMSDDVLQSEKADTQAGRLAVVAQAGAQAARQRCEEILEKIKMYQAREPVVHINQAAAAAPAAPPSAPPEVVQDIADIRGRLETIEAALSSPAPAAPQPDRAVDLPEGIPQQVADLEDDIKLLSAAILAVQAYAAGAENGDFYWHGGKEEFRWRNSEGVMEPMDAEMYIAHFNEVMLRR